MICVFIKIKSKVFIDPKLHPWFQTIVRQMIEIFDNLVGGYYWILLVGTKLDNTYNQVRQFIIKANIGVESDYHFYGPKNRKRENQVVNKLIIIN